jgi:hypothetical protein
MDLLIEAMESLATFDFSSDRTAGAHELVQLVANSATFRRNHSTSIAACSISSFKLWTRTALSSASSQATARWRYQPIACSSSINDTIAWCAASVCSARVSRCACRSSLDTITPDHGLRMPKSNRLGRLCRPLPKPLGHAAKRAYLSRVALQTRAPPRVIPAQMA